jgi:hypothetical protein
MLRGRITRALWLGLLAFLGLYVYGIVIGAFSPAELIGFTVIAAVGAVLFSVHLFRVHRVMSDPGHPEHDRLMRGTQHERERRGF